VTGEPTATERESVTAYLGRLAHDLRSPLSALLSYSALLREGALGPVNDAQRAALDDVVASARELAAIIGAIAPEQAFTRTSETPRPPTDRQPA